MRLSHGLVAALAILASGCASYDGRGLVPGKSTATEVQTLMGTPDEKVRVSPTEIAWFYPRPGGRETYVVRIGPGEVVLAVEQRLTRENIDRIRRNEWTERQVRALLGPPEFESSLSIQPRRVWEYRWRDYEENRILWVQFAPDGTVSEVLEMHDFSADSQGDAGADLD